ncbi:potassium-transporting ATPase subunit KdpA [Criblamydia sequanensis]|uniref:Potassium-transporting ATPase potassium-binding subunit n=1 Tax=Candidatus Criblamydia sequanensis CRIB-18 TaxID=1437425 RepID=A0A090D244_9BACT|nr:potassium-transporting ATPase subunit KdpA [Criblamydia sequanensis]CDR34053.1 Potassium-transporting ATPase A chain [Criblamydia sequanensis CRIB-18]
MNHWAELVSFFLFLLGTSLFLGRYLWILFKDHPSFTLPIFSSTEAKIYKICSIDCEEEMTAKNYMMALLFFNLLGLAFLFALLLLQGVLPLNPENLSGVEPLLALNTAISFTTNTNWQAYAGETTLSYLSGMLGLTVQNYLSAATGFAALLTLIRGFTRQNSTTVGNFWKDLTRFTLYVLLPLSLLFSLFLVSQGAIQTLEGALTVETLENAKQTIPRGPAASQVAIKQIGSNGGGFFNANSAHPFENPTPLTNFLETWAILIIPGATLYMYALMIESKKEAAPIFACLLIFFLTSVFASFLSEIAVNPNMAVNPVLEGKETRFGIYNSVLFANATTATSNGSTNCSHSSLSPLAGGLCLFNMMLGEVIFGGVGVGLAGLLLFILLTVFLSGLMVGRTPEYLGKKVEKQEMKWVMLALLFPSLLILLGAAIALSLPSVLDTLTEGPHGLTEILYAFTSAAANNGSAFASLNANTPFFNVVLSVIMLASRLTILLAAIAIGGHLALKKRGGISLGSFSTASPLFGLLLFFVIFIVAGLTFFPALSLGPILEEMLMRRSVVF